VVLKLEFENTIVAGCVKRMLRKADVFLSLFLS
jgi:hypothetical protein